MSDAMVEDLAQRAGIAVRWVDHADRPRTVPAGTLRAVLAALGLPCSTRQEIIESNQALAAAAPPALITAAASEPIELPTTLANDASRGRLHYEDGAVEDITVERSTHAARLPPLSRLGYHTLEIGKHRVTLAVAPPRCRTIAEATERRRSWGLAVQIYGLRSTGDCGIGDMAGVIALAREAAAFDADALALSPMHALFAGEPGQFSPYSPSSRLFYNPLHADARCLFGEEQFSRALRAAAPTAEIAALAALTEIDWPRAARMKMALLRHLFDDFRANDLAGDPSAPTARTPCAADFTAFRAAGGALLQDHACFEALHAARLAADPAAGNWIGWPPQWRDSHGAAVREFAQQNGGEILFHLFLQWVADRSVAAAQLAAREAGMRIGLIADLAVGMSGAGSHAWTSQNDILIGLGIGAPPDAFNSHGQNWQLTTFSPRALAATGYAPFTATLQACMRHAGGLRIDHAMGLTRLWVIPHGAKADEGAYLTFPAADLLRLTALESHRHRAVVIGEDLGTVPAGFRERLTASGIAGMRVLWFARDRGGFIPPAQWPAEVAAMTSTHDLPTVGGWWRGHDIAVRAQGGLISDEASEQAARASDRDILWRAFRSAGVDSGPVPTLDAAPRIADAAVKFIAETPAALALVPLEDALSLDEQPNVPGSIEGHPNWRRRYPAESGALLSRPGVRDRLRPLSLRHRS